MKHDLDQVFKDMNKVFAQMDDTFKKVDKDMDRVFKQMEKVLEQAEEQVARKIETMPWKPWFAWRPVRVKGKRIWMKKIYRRKINTYVDYEDWARYEYGDIFDVLKEAGNGTKH